MLANSSVTSAPSYLHVRRLHWLRAARPSDPTKPWDHPSFPKGDAYQRFTHGLASATSTATASWTCSRKRLVGTPALDDATPWKKHDFNSAARSAQMYAYDVDGDGDNDVITALDAHGYGLAWYET
jgi:hypothetical protein